MQHFPHVFFHGICILLWIYPDCSWESTEARQDTSHWHFRELPLGFPGGSDSQESVCNVGDPGLIPGLGRSPGEGNGYPLQYSDLESHMNRRTWQATVQGVTKSWTRLSDCHCPLFSKSAMLLSHDLYPIGASTSEHSQEKVSVL